MFTAVLLWCDTPLASRSAYRVTIAVVARDEWRRITYRHLLVKYLQSQKAGIAVVYLPLIKLRISPATAEAQDSGKLSSA